MRVYGDQILNHVPNQTYTEVRKMLDSEGVSVTRMSRRLGTYGFLTEVLGVGFIDGRKPDKQAKVGLVGVCLPETINLQTTLPLVVAKDLLDRDILKKLYVALPVAAYAIAGLPKFDLYRQVVSLIDSMFNGRVGEQVILMPDYRILEDRSKLALMASPHTSDRFALHKYPFRNLFAYTEVAGYGADVAIPAIAEQEKVMIIADFMQYESIHAGSHTTHFIGGDMSGVVLPLLSPHVEKGELVHISQMDEKFDQADNLCPEISPLFLAGLLVTKEDEVRQIYADYAKSAQLPDDLSIKVQSQQRVIARYPEVSERRLKDLEDKSIEQLHGVGAFINRRLEEILRYGPR